MAVVVGAVVTIVDTLFPNKFSTILEVDYDTPYRYFVGNDAHLYGVNGLANGHICSHHSASATSSNATDSTCCGLPLSGQSSTGSRSTVTKTKSDASTSTSQELDDVIDERDNGATTNIKVAAVMSEDIESNNNNNKGIVNEAFVKVEDEDDNDQDSDVSTTIIDGKRAVSLQNFGKFVTQQRDEKAKDLAGFRNRNPAPSCYNHMQMATVYHH